MFEASDAPTRKKAFFVAGAGFGLSAVGNAVEAVANPNGWWLFGLRVAAAVVFAVFLIAWIVLLVADWRAGRLREAERS